MYSIRQRGNEYHNDVVLTLSTGQRQWTKTVDKGIKQRGNEYHNDVVLTFSTGQR